MTEFIDVPFDEAVARLPDGDQIHTYAVHDALAMLIGANLSRERVVELLKKLGACESGPMGKERKHGLAVMMEDGSVLFIATKDKAAWPTGAAEQAP